MKKNVLIFFALFLFASLQAQSDFTPPYYQLGKLYVGYVVLNDGTKVDGYIQAQVPASDDLLAGSNQTRVIFYKNPQDKKTKTIYKPQDLRAYKIDDKEYHSLDYGDLIGPKQNFVLFKKEGRIRTYGWYVNDSDKRTLEEKLVLRKGDEKPFDMGSMLLSFSKKMSEIVQEDAELAAKITAKVKGYGLFNVLEIVAEYNDWYAKNNN